MVNNLIVRFIESSSQMLLRQGKTNSISNTLTKRSCVRNTKMQTIISNKDFSFLTMKLEIKEYELTSRDFNTRCLKVLRVTRCFASPLAERFQVFFLFYWFDKKHNEHPNKTLKCKQHAFLDLGPRSAISMGLTISPFSIFHNPNYSFCRLR